VFAWPKDAERREQGDDEASGKNDQKRKKEIHEKWTDIHIHQM
jgi:hypothetical protein